jgi:hypothetical protein
MFKISEPYIKSTACYSGILTFEDFLVAAGNIRMHHYRYGIGLLRDLFFITLTNAFALRAGAYICEEFQKSKLKALSISVT